MQKEMKGNILLFNPRADVTKRESEVRILQLGLLAISAILEKEGYKIKILHSLDKDKYMQALLSDDEYTCVGISSMTGYQIYDGLKFAGLVRKYRPKTPIVWGGPHPTTLPLQTLENPFVDIVVKGQGERTFAELVHRLERQESLEELLGIAYKKDGRIINNPDRPFEDINNFPSLPFHILGDDFEKYVHKGEFGSRTVRYYTSYGCPYRCGFCELSKFTKRRWSGLNPDRVISDIEKLIKDYNIDSINIVDPNFFVNTNRVVDICNGLLKKGIKIYLEKVNGRPEQMNRFSDELWTLIEKAGCRSVLIGAESGNDEVMDIIKKDAVVSDTIEFAHRAKKFNIKIVYAFMIVGTPHPEPLKTRSFQLKQYNDTLDLIRKILDISVYAHFLIFVYTPYPGTDLYEVCLKNGLKEKSTLLEWARYRITVSNVPWVPRSIAKKVPDIWKYLEIHTISCDKLKGKKANALTRFFMQMALNLTKMRLKHRFFSFPVEARAFRIYEAIK